MSEPYDVHAALRNPSVALTVALGRWETRDDTRPQPQVRQAANDAVRLIDVMLARLHVMRSRLVTEIREADAANDARLGVRAPEAGDG